MSRLRTAGAVSSALICCAVVAKGLTFVRETVLAASFGASATADALVFALGVPDVISTALAVSVAATFLPAFSAVVHKDGQAAAVRSVSALLTVMVVALGSVVVFGEVAAPWLVRWLAPGFQRETMVLAIGLTRWTLPVIVVLQLGSVIGGVLQSRGEAVHAAVAGVIAALTGVVFAAAAGLSGIVGVASAGILVSLTVAVAMQMEVLRRGGYRHRWILDTRDPLIRRMSAMAAPVILSTLLGQAVLVVTRRLASHLEAGSMAALNYAAQLQLAPLHIVDTVIAGFAFPLLASAVAAGNDERARDLLTHSFRGLLLALTPCATLMLVFHSQIASAVFARGAFDALAISRTSSALACLAPGIVFMSLRNLGNRMLFASAKASMTIAGAAMEACVGVAMSYMLAGTFGHCGLAIASSAASAAGAATCLWMLRRTGTGTGPLLACVGRVLAAAVSMWVVLRTCVLLSGQDASPGGLVCCGAAVAGLLVFACVCETDIVKLMASLREPVGAPVALAQHS